MGGHIQKNIKLSLKDLQKKVREDSENSCRPIPPLSFKWNSPKCEICFIPFIIHKITRGKSEMHRDEDQLFYSFLAGKGNEENLMLGHFYQIHYCNLVVYLCNNNLLNIY